MAAGDHLIDSLFDGRYLIIRKLGSGGMANVYLAQDQELGRRVAIKILDDRHAADEQFVERFRREAQNAAGLSHPNIVSIYDRGEAEGTYYIAMEYVEGRTLKELLVAPRPVAARDRDRLHAPDPLRAPLRAPERDRPPRHQAAQRDRRRRGPREGDGLRDRARRRREPDDGGRLDHRHGAVPLARAGARRARRPDVRSLLDRDRPLRAAHGDGAVHRRDARRDRDEAPLAGARRRRRRTGPTSRATSTTSSLRALAKDPADRYHSAEEMDSDLERIARGIGVSAETAEAATSVLSRTDVGEAATTIRPAGPAAATGSTTYTPGRYYEYDAPPRRRSSGRGCSGCCSSRSRSSAAGSPGRRSSPSSTRDKPVAVPDVDGSVERLAVQQIENAGLQELVDPRAERRRRQAGRSSSSRIRSPASGSSAATSSRSSSRPASRRSRVPDVVGKTPRRSGLGARQRRG